MIDNQAPRWYVMRHLSSLDHENSSMSYNSGQSKIPPPPRNCPPGLRIWLARRITPYFSGFESKGLNFMER